MDGVSLLTRSEKRKDRVEIGPEQLTMAAIEAEVKVFGRIASNLASLHPQLTKVLHNRKSQRLQARQRALLDG